MRNWNPFAQHAAAFAIALVTVLVLAPVMAFANPFASAEQQVRSATQSIRMLFYAIAVIAVIGAALMSLSGRWPWSRFFAIFGAVVVVAMAENIVSYLRSVS